MNEKIEKAKDILDDVGHKADDFVDDKAEKHGFTKFQVWLGIGIAVLALYGLWEAIK